MKVQWTEQAYARLAAIYDFVAYDNPPAADRLIQALIDRADRLSRFPMRGRSVPELRDPSIREVVYRKYRLVYRVRSEAVELLTVFEGHLPLPVADIVPE